MKVVALIVAAGLSTRFNRKLKQPKKNKSTVNVKKQFVTILNKPILFWTVEALERIRAITEMVIVLPKDDYTYWTKVICQKYSKVSKTVIGGFSRYDSVLAGLKVISNEINYIAIHDAVRPLVSRSVILNTLFAAQKNGAAVPGINPVDTVKVLTDKKNIFRTLPRERVWLIQTPQIFRTALIKRLYFSYPKTNKPNFTDDAALLERSGYKFAIVPGDYRNLKVTNYTDLNLIKFWLPLRNKLF